MDPSSTVDQNLPEQNQSVANVYTPLANRRDEAVDRGGQLREEWGALFESIQRHGDGILTKWRNESSRISRERGLAYRSESIHGSAESTAGWSLDPVPWIISQEHWSAIERGLQQRIRLYCAMLKDLYGTGRMLSENLVPSQIIESHPGFLRSLYDCPPDARRPGLGLVAIDLARDNAGQFFVLNNRTDSPFGVSLALENRTVVNSVLPNLFHRNRVRRIGHFFVSWFDHLASFSPPENPHPSIAILDANSMDEDSEISFLANYCGILRVIPSDLTVRGGRVWLKTVGGLKPIDVLWRNIAGRSLDPLETGHVGSRGIPGNFEALRKTNVAIAGHPGSEVLQSPGLFPYLPKICRALLGEDLLIPPVATWWCGQKRERQYVLENLSNMVVKSVGPHREFETTYGSLLSRDQLEDLRSRIESRPEKYVGQERLTFSTIPMSSSSGMTPRGAVLRTFGFHGRKDIVHIMPGGLARLGTTNDVVISTRLGGESKDVWIRHSESDSLVSLPKELRRFQFAQPETTSHAAENLFWAGRNAERIDFISRFLHRIITGRMFGFYHDPDGELQHENFLVKALYTFSGGNASTVESQSNGDKIMRLLSPDKKNFSLSRQIDHFRRNTSATREHWSTACIRAIESIEHDWADSTRNLTDLFAFMPCLEELQRNLAAFYGINHDSMTRDHGWSMLESGRLLERCVNITRLLQFRLEEAIPDVIRQLIDESILFLFDSFGTYQKANRAETETRTIFLLVLDESNYPRSIRFLLNRIQTALAKLPEAGDEVAHPVEYISRLRSGLDACCEVLHSDQDSTFPVNAAAMSARLKALEEDLYSLGVNITKAYFNLIGEGRK